MYTYQVCLVYSLCCTRQLLTNYLRKLALFPRDKIQKLRRLFCLYVPSPSSQLALFVRFTGYTHLVCLVNSRCLYETTLKVEAIVRVYLPSSTSKLTLFVSDNFYGRDDGPFVLHCNLVRLVNSRCLYETTIKGEPINRVYFRRSPT